MNVNIKKLHEDAEMPKYAHEGDAGVDLVAIEDVIIEPGETALVKTGLAFELPDGYEMMIRPRSGITLKTKLRVQLGTVDSHFRGEVGVIVDNTANFADLFDIPTIEDFYVIYGIDGRYYCGTNNIKEGGGYIIRKGDRIAQAVIAPVSRAQFTEVETLGETARGVGGFGSSGVSAE
ncbi:dUTP diphosphatase [Cytobacillus purgationiresistens]|uniref:dUTP diphosphatase n=1 Tax=Cytobacillus purgationiresistens TaxID=863449 RepID=A0ABU0AHM5_9BACI|nr:deoxyuridine 5'-triphosphate nucleotidohydrolase [Cytobacillus purgationiresistens]MDQ0270759.1 dUTP pyrophosphatase [Cytobacillus purgationiresistens]